MNQSKQFDRLDQFAKLMAPPADQVQGPGVSSWPTSKILNGPPFLFDVRTDYVKVTNDTVLVPLTLQIRNKDITFNTKDGVSTGTVNILGRVSNLNHRVVQTFEDTVKVRGAQRAAGAARRTTSRSTGRRCRCVRALQDRHRHQGREQPGPRRRLAAQRQRAEV